MGDIGKEIRGSNWPPCVFTLIKRTWYFQGYKRLAELLRWCCGGRINQQQSALCHIYTCIQYVAAASLRSFWPRARLKTGILTIPTINEIRAYSRRAGCALRINRRRTLNGQWADLNWNIGKPWLRPMLTLAALRVNKYRTLGESRVCSGHWNDRRPFERQTDCERWVDTQWTRSGQKTGHERTMGKRAMNEQQTSGESVASIQPIMYYWQRSRFEICERSPDDGIQRATSLSLSEHDLRQWTDSYCNTSWVNSKKNAIRWVLQNVHSCCVSKIYHWQIRNKSSMFATHLFHN